MEETKPDLTARIDAIEIVLDDLRDRIETCQQAMIMSRAAVALGLATCAIVLTVATAYSTAPIVFGAFTAMIGGVVWLGANKSTKEELEAKRLEVEAQKDALFDQIAARNGWVGNAERTYH